MRIYEHRQGHGLFKYFIPGGIIVALLVVRQPGGFLAAGLVLAITLLTLWLFGSLTVRVSDDALTFWFGPGVIRKVHTMADIVEAQPVRNRWWYGWGIHLTPFGWLYNVTGLDAVQIRLVNGKQFRLGTDEPERLVTAIREAMERRPR